MSCIRDDPRFEELERNKNILNDQLQTRGNEFKKATQNYLSSLSRELNVFLENNDKYDKRNANFKTDIDNIMTRYRISIGNISKANDRLNYEKEKINSYIIKNFSQISNKVKDTLKDEKNNIERIIDAELEYRKLPPPEQKHEGHERRKIVPKDKPYVTNYHDLYNNVNSILGDQKGERTREFVNREKNPVINNPIVAENRENYLNYMNRQQNQYDNADAYPNDIGRLSEKIDREYGIEHRNNPNNQARENNGDNIIKQFLEEGQPTYLPRVSEGNFGDAFNNRNPPQNQFDTFNAPTNSNLRSNGPATNYNQDLNNFMVGSGVKNTEKRIFEAKYDDWQEENFGRIPSQVFSNNTSRLN